MTDTIMGFNANELPNGTFIRDSNTFSDFVIINHKWHLYKKNRKHENSHCYKNENNQNTFVKVLVCHEHAVTNYSQYTDTSYPSPCSANNCDDSLKKKDEEKGDEEKGEEEKEQKKSRGRPKKNIVKRLKKPSDYNEFVRQFILDNSTTISSKECLKMAAKEWKNKKMEK